MEASKCKMEAMEQTIEENEREIGTLRSLEQQVFVQTRTISHQDLRIEELSSELQRFEAVERVHESELERRAQHIEQLRQRLEETTERAHHVEDLERALEDAVSLTEQQNSCNEEVRGHSIPSAQHTDPGAVLLVRLTNSLSFPS